MLGGTAFGVIGLLFLIAAIRTFTATLYQGFFGELPNTVLGAIAVAAFATSFAAIIVAARFGPRRAIAGSGALLAVATLLGTAARNEWLDLILSVAAIAAGTWWLALTQAARSPAGSAPFPVAVPAALVVDAALRSAFGTSFVDGPPAIALPLTLVAVLIFLAAGIAHASGDLVWTSPGKRGALGLLALAPLLFVSETGGGNAAQVAAAGGLGLGPESAHSTQIGAMLVGLGAGLGAFLLTRDLPRRPIAAVAIAVGAVLLWAHIPVLSLAGGVIFAAGILVAASALVTAPATDARGPALTVVALGVGWILLVAGAFGFYAFYAFLPAAWAATAFVALVILVVPPVAGPRWGLGAALLVTSLAVLVPLTSLLTLPTAASVDVVPATFRVMTYNVHQGYDAGNVPSLEALVDTISREAPDVLVLEEVVRGWMIDGQHDVLGVLSARLGMSYVFGPNIGDLYGNAILSRYPMTDVRRVSYAKEPGARYQPRGVLLVTVGGVLILATHLDEHADASAVRLEQVRTLLREWNGRQPAIIACDCNALPEAPELALIDAAGFGDLAAQAGGKAFTFPSDAPRERIDYLFGVGVQAAQAHVVESTASDHRALIANITRSAR